MSDTILNTKDVIKVTGITRKSLILWSHDGRFPKPIRRKNTNEPYRWRREDVERWLNPKAETKALNKEEIRQIVQQELIKLLRSTAPASPLVR